jgi:hypothetical protein
VLVSTGYAKVNMKLRMLYVLFAAMTAITAGLAGCKPAPPPAATPAAPASNAAPAADVKPAPSVTEITLGTAIGMDKKVTAPATTFAKSDQVYAAVELTGSGSASVAAKWSRNNDGKFSAVSEAREEVTANGSAVSTFNAGTGESLTPGSYQVEVFLNGKSAGTRSFTVK